MSDPVTVAALGASATIIVAVITVFGTKLSGRVKAIQGQVENEHFRPDGTPINLRDDLDGKHGETLRILAPMQRDIAWLMRRQAETDDRLDDFEDTLQGRKPE